MIRVWRLRSLVWPFSVLTLIDFTWQRIYKFFSALLFYIPSPATRFERHSGLRLSVRERDCVCMHLWSHTKVCEHSVVQSTCGNFTKFTTLVHVGTVINCLCLGRDALIRHWLIIVQLIIGAWQSADCRPVPINTKKLILLSYLSIYLGCNRYPGTLTYLKDCRVQTKQKRTENKDNWLGFVWRQNSKSRLRPNMVKSLIKNCMVPAKT